MSMSDCVDVFQFEMHRAFCAMHFTGNNNRNNTKFTENRQIIRASIGIAAVLLSTPETMAHNAVGKQQEDSCLKNETTTNEGK